MTVPTIERLFEPRADVSRAKYRNLLGRPCPCVHCPGHEVTTESVYALLARLVVTAEPDGCWRSDGGRDQKGYRDLRLWDYAAKRDVPIHAHRLVYDLCVGDLTTGLQVDHLCHTSACPGGPTCPHRRCVRPDHLALTDNHGNSRRRTVRPAHEGLPPHGTTTRAGSRYRCKCEPCLQANRTYRAERRAFLAGSQ